MSDKRIKAGIIGASGYTGYELIKLLKKHVFVDTLVRNSSQYKDKKVKELYPDYSDDEVFTDYTIDEIKNQKLDVIFLAVPHTKAMEIVPKLSGTRCKIIDLSADYRFKKPEEYEKAYKLTHTDKARKAVYGLPELFREKIKKAKFIANPGCYATGMICSAYPVQKLAKYIVFDCVSGWSGAGKSSIYAKDPSVAKDNFIAYNLVAHRHKYEVMQFIRTKLSFTPHVIDAYRGMMITAHILLKKQEDVAVIKQTYKDFYKDSPFVKVVDGLPDLHMVQNTNKLLIGGFELDENNQLVIVAVLDNLGKGASSQGVQNMNLMFGFKEDESLS